MKEQFYMTRAPELAKQPDALPMFSKIASLAGDSENDVLACLWLAWNFFHVVDDVVDEGNVDDELKENIAHGLFDLVENILTSSEPTDPGFLNSLSRMIAAAPWDEERKQLADNACRDFFGDLIVNVFIRRNARQFLAIYQQTIDRWLAGDEMASSSIPFRRQLAPAVRCGDVDFIVFVAKLAGGWSGMRWVSKLRDYDP